MQPGGTVRRDGLGQRRQQHPSRRVDRDQAERFGSQSRHVHRPHDAQVHASRGIRHEFGPTDARAPDAIDGPGAGDQHGDQIGRRGAGDEQSSGGCREVEQIGHPTDDLALHLDGRMIAPAKVGVQPGGEHLADDPRRISAAMHPTHEPRMDVAGGVGEDQPLELGGDIGEIHRAARQRRRQFAAQCGGHLLPDRLVANVARVVENAIEARMGGGAKRLPVPRIEGRAVRHVVLDLRPRGRSTHPSTTFNSGTTGLPEHRMALM